MIGSAVTPVRCICATSESQRKPPRMAQLRITVTTTRPRNPRWPSRGAQQIGRRRAAVGGPAGEAEAVPARRRVGDAPLATCSSSGAKLVRDVLDRRPPRRAPRARARVRSTSQAPAVSSASTAARSMRTRRAGGSRNWSNLRSSAAAPARRHSPPARSTSGRPRPPPRSSLPPSRPFYREARHEMHARQPPRMRCGLSARLRPHISAARACRRKAGHGPQAAYPRRAGFPEAGDPVLRHLDAAGPSRRLARDGHRLAEALAPQGPILLVGIESRGFLVAAPLAYSLGCGFVMVRKRGKLPGATIPTPTISNTAPTRSRSRPTRSSAGPARRSSLDDLLATGGTMQRRDPALPHGRRQVSSPPPASSSWPFSAGASGSTCPSLRVVGYDVLSRPVEEPAGDRHDQRHGNQKDRRERVDMRRHAQTYAREDHHRQRGRGRAPR